MSWQRIKKLILAFIATFLLILISGVAVDRSDRDLSIFQMGTDVIVAEKRIMTDAVAIGGNVTILNEGQVTNDAVAIGGDVILKPDARVGGDAVTIGGQIIKESGAIIEGDEVVIFSNAGAFIDRFGLFGALYAIAALFTLGTFIVILACGVCLLMLLPERLQSITATMFEYSFKSGVWGLGGIVTIILFTTLFAGSIFGFLLIPIVNLVFVLLALLGAIATALWIGKKILPRQKQFIPFLIGMLVLAVISLIPIAGGLIVLMLALFGFGAVLLSRVGTIQPESMEKRSEQLDNSTQLSGG
jgi:hypothetical protein